LLRRRCRVESCSDNMTSLMVRRLPKTLPRTNPSCRTQWTSSSLTTSKSRWKTPPAGTESFGQEKFAYNGLVFGSSQFSSCLRKATFNQKLSKKDFVKFILLRHSIYVTLCSVPMSIQDVLLCYTVVKLQERLELVLRPFN